MQLVIGHNSDVLDQDLFKYNHSPKRFYKVFDRKVYNKTKRAFEMWGLIGTGKNKVFSDEDYAESFDIMKQFAEARYTTVSKAIKECKNRFEEFNSELIGYATYKCWYDSKQLVVESQPDSATNKVIVEETTLWTDYLKTLSKNTEKEQETEAEK